MTVKVVLEVIHQLLKQMKQAQYIYWNSKTLAFFFCFCAAFHRNFFGVGYRNFCSEATEISVTHTTEISVKSIAKADDSSFISCY